MKNTENIELVPNWWDSGICLITGFYTNPGIKALTEQKAKLKSRKRQKTPNWG